MSKVFETWQEARDYAQGEADRMGLSFGIEKPTPYQAWSVKMLPRPENRFGWELRCEAVEPTILRRKARRSR